MKNRFMMNGFPVLVIVIGVLLAPIRAEAILQFDLGPRVTTINTSGVPLPEMGDKSLTGNIIWKANPSLAGGYGGTVYGKVAAQVQGTNGGSVLVKKWLPLAIPGSGVAKLTRVAIQAGALVAGGLLTEWASKKALEWADGKLYQQGQPSATVGGKLAPGATPPPAAWISDHWGEHPDCGQQADSRGQVLLYATVDDMGIAANAAGAPGVQDCAGGWCARTLSTTHPKKPECVSYQPKDVLVTRYAYPQNSANSWWVDPTYLEEMNDSQIEGAVGDSLANPADSGHQEARRLADQALGETGAAVSQGNQGWPYSITNNSWGPYFSTNNNHKTDIQNVYDNSVTNNQQTIILNAGDEYITNEEIPPDPDNPVQPKPATGLTKQEVREAVKGGLDDAAAETHTINGVPASPPEEPPEKKSISGVLTAFKDGIASLPILSVLESQKPSSGGGQSWINLPLASVMGGGSIRVDFADYEGILDWMGNALLGIVGLAWILFLFRGRGEG